MTTFTTIKDYPCAVCGAKHEQTVLRSTNQMGPSDLDGRPAEMARSTMPYWVQTCPDCGYCSSDISNTDPKIQEIVKSSIYQQQLTSPDFPELANKFLCEALIKEMLGQHLVAANSFIHAAWCCDDTESLQSATYCRNKAIELIRKATPKEHLDKRYNIEPEVFIDLLRRAGRFTEASELVRSILNDKQDYFSLRLLKFQEKLIEKGDTRKYTTEDATGVIKSARSFSKLADYLSFNYHNLLTKHEQEAVNVRGCIDDEGEHWLSNDPAVLNLLVDGIERLAERIAERLTTSYPGKVVINRCPKCNGITRTARAKQCQHCHFDWH
ncbi:MAG: DUF2225 domain-containing protein [Acidobacteriota bacterium]